MGNKPIRKDAEQTKIILNQIFPSVEVCHLILSYAFLPKRISIKQVWSSNQLETSATDKYSIYGLPIAVTSKSIHVCTFDDDLDTSPERGVLLYSSQLSMISKQSNMDKTYLTYPHHEHLLSSRVLFDMVVKPPNMELVYIVQEADHYTFVNDFRELTNEVSPNASGWTSKMYPNKQFLFRYCPIEGFSCFKYPSSQRISIPLLMCARLVCFCPFPGSIPKVAVVQESCPNKIVLLEFSNKKWNTVEDWTLYSIIRDFVFEPTRQLLLVALEDHSSNFFQPRCQIYVFHMPGLSLRDCKFLCSSCVEFPFSREAFLRFDHSCRFLSYKPHCEPSTISVYQINLS
jgi:hypothetical protein